MGKRLPICALICKRRGPPVSRSYWMAKYIFIACGANGGRSHHDPHQSQTVRAQCRAGKSDRSGWWTVERTLRRPGVAGLLALIVFYKIGDAVAASLQTAFLIGGMGFSVSEVGYVKGLGLGATLIGALVGGAAMAKLGMVRSLLIFGLLQAVSNLGFMWLAWMGKSYAALTTSILVENVTGGMGTAAFVALIMSLCDHRYTATQFALLSSLEALGRVSPVVHRPTWSKW